jgi:hypothetical protein
MNGNINMDSTTAGSMNGNINMDSTTAGSMNGNINMDSTTAGSGRTWIFKDHIRDFNKGRHPAICRRFKRVKSPVRLLETKIFFH